MGIKRNVAHLHLKLIQSHKIKNSWETDKKIIRVEFFWAEMSLGLFCLLITITIIQWTNSQLLDMKCLPSGTTPCIHTISSQEKSEVKEKCGKKSPSLSKGYIVDGQEIEWNSAPWTAAIVDKNKSVFVRFNL
jgi:hypothetical protein